MTVFKKSPSHEGYLPLDEEKKRLALLVCAAKRLADSIVQRQTEISSMEAKMLEGVGYDIFYTAKHFKLNQEEFETEISNLSLQFFEDGTYDAESKIFKEENHDKIQKLRREMKQNKKHSQLKNKFIGNVDYHSTIKH